MVQPWGRIDIWQKSRINYICESRSYKKNYRYSAKPQYNESILFFWVCFIFHDSTNMDKNLLQQSVAKIQRTFVTPHCPKSIVALIFKSQAFYGGEDSKQPIVTDRFQLSVRQQTMKYSISSLSREDRIKINLSFYLLRCSVILCESDLEGEVPKYLSGQLRKS